MIKTTKTPYYECSRCEADNSTKKANSLNKEWCPCPRGNCDAELIGQIITTTTIIKNNKKK
jgi:hypothetical protein